MKSYHILKRGDRYHFVCRVPLDLIQHFPHPIISRSLKTNDKKDARVLAAAFEHKTQGVFVKIRSGHLDDNTIKQIVVNYLSTALLTLEAQVKGKVFNTYLNQAKIEECGGRAVIANNDLLEKANRLGDLMSRIMESANRIADDPDFHARFAESRETEFKAALLKGGNSHSHAVVDEYAQKYNLTLDETEHKSLQKRLLHLDIMLAEAEKEAYRDASWTRLEMLKAFLDKEKSAIKQKYFLADVYTAYMSQYDDNKCTVKVNSLRAVKRETSFILKTLGKDKELAYFNSKKAVDKLRAALGKKKKSTGEPLAGKTGSEYLKRLSSIVAFAIEKYELDVVNKITGTHTSVGQTKLRDSYSDDDMKLLVDALCTVPMLHGRKPHPRNDRFWIILISLLHGFRKAAIVNLMEKHIVTDSASKLECFDLRIDAGTNDKTTIKCPIHPLLIRLGFLEWLDRTRVGIANKKLFEDTPASFGQWWNGTKAENSWNRLHVTSNSKVTFHSFRHYFCTWADELDVSEKLKNEMSGHAVRHVGDDVKSKHYLERTRAKRMRGVQLKSMEENRILMDDIDWERLEKRARELFEL